MKLKCPFCGAVRRHVDYNGAYWTMFEHIRHAHADGKFFPIVIKDGQTRCEVALESAIAHVHDALNGVKDEDLPGV